MKEREEEKDQLTQNFWTNVETLFGEEFRHWLSDQPYLAKGPARISRGGIHHPQTAHLEYMVGFGSQQWTFCFSTGEIHSSFYTDKPEYTWGLNLRFPGFYLGFYPKKSRILQRDSSTLEILHEVPKAPPRYLLDGSLLRLAISSQGSVAAQLTYQGCNPYRPAQRKDTALISECTTFRWLENNMVEVKTKPPLWPEETVICFPRSIHYQGPIYGGDCAVSRQEIVVPTEKSGFQLI